MKLIKFRLKIYEQLNRIEETPFFVVEKHHYSDATEPNYFFSFEPKTQRGKNFLDFYLELAAQEIYFTEAQISAHKTIFVLEISIDKFLHLKD